MITQPLSPYVQGKIVGENWCDGEPIPVCPFPAGTQAAVDFQHGIMEGSRLRGVEDARKPDAERRRLDAQTNVTWEDG